MSQIGLLDHFSALKDPRQAWKVIYPLPEILLLVLCGTMAGAEDFADIERWAKRKLDFLRRFLPFERGVPSHDTLNDVMNALPAGLFSDCFVSWVSALRERAPNIDAIGCQRDIAEAIRARGADYLLALKDSRPSLAQEVSLFFERGPASAGEAFVSIDGDRDRVETRRRRVNPDVKHFILNLIKAMPDIASLKTKPETLGWDDNYLADALTQPWK